MQELLERFGVRPEDLPALIVRGKLLLRKPTNLEVAEHFGFTNVIDKDKVHDLVVIGAGPAGLTAAVYAASEGHDMAAPYPGVFAAGDVRAACIQLIHKAPQE
ncbi:MAG TPA: FAD-binding protein [Myxococcales bacterium]